jgi:hypothetical protein
MMTVPGLALQRPRPEVVVQVRIILVMGLLIVIVVGLIVLGEHQPHTEGVIPMPSISGPSIAGASGAFLPLGTFSIADGSVR